MLKGFSNPFSVLADSESVLAVSSKSAVSAVSKPDEHLTNDIYEDSHAQTINTSKPFNILGDEFKTGPVSYAEFCKNNSHDFNAEIEAFNKESFDEVEYQKTINEENYKPEQLYIIHKGIQNYLEQYGCFQLQNHLRNDYTTNDFKDANDRFKFLCNLQLTSKTMVNLRFIEMCEYKMIDDFMLALPEKIRHSREVLAQNISQACRSFKTILLNHSQINSYPLTVENVYIGNHIYMCNETQEFFDFVKLSILTFIEAYKNINKPVISEYAKAKIPGFDEHDTFTITKLSFHNICQEICNKIVGYIIGDYRYGMQKPTITHGASEYTVSILSFELNYLVTQCIATMIDAMPWNNPEYGKYYDNPYLEERMVLLIYAITKIISMAGITRFSSNHKSQVIQFSRDYLQVKYNQYYK